MVMRRVYCCCPCFDTTIQLTVRLAEYGIQILPGLSKLNIEALRGCAAVLVLGGVECDRVVIEGVDLELPIFREVKDLINWSVGDHS